MVEIRDATPDDAAAMARIQSDSLRDRAGDYYTDEQLAHLAPTDPAAAIPDEAFAADDRSLVVAESDGEVVGWGSVDLAAGVLAATFVDPAHAGDGIGRRLVERLETVARDAGLARLTVYASLNAVGFYERLGFERRGEVDAGGPDAPEIPGVEMERRL